MSSLVLVMVTMGKVRISWMAAMWQSSWLVYGISGSAGRASIGAMGPLAMTGIMVSTRDAMFRIRVIYIVLVLMYERNDYLSLLEKEE